MKSSKLLVSTVIALFLLVSIAGCNEKDMDSALAKTSKLTISKEDLESEAWQMEERYWDFVEKMDTVAYKDLWHNDFIGYPSFGDGVSNKSKIAIWIPELHQDPNLRFSYKLYKKAVNAIDEVVIVFYDADEIWTDKENQVVRKETLKFTHTWKKDKDNWVMLGGMAAKKNQHKLNN